jgi:hypothetical protein
VLNLIDRVLEVYREPSPSPDHLERLLYDDVPPLPEPPMRSYGYASSTR